MSTLTKVTDKGGNCFHAHKVDGEYSSPFPTHVDYGVYQKMIKELKIRDDDVFIIGYPKSGAHWVWEITGMLLAGATEYQKQVKETQFLEFIRTEKLDSLTSPRILNTHFLFRYLPNEMIEKKTKIIYLLRNPKDVLVSFYNHITGMTGSPRQEYNTDWASFLQSSLEGKVRHGLWFDYVLDYEKTFADNPHLPVCTIVYEDMKEDPVSNIKRLSEFLGVTASSEFCQKVADACSFKKLRQAYEVAKGHSMKFLWKPGQTLYRKGEVGDWKNWFTVAQNEQFDAMYRDKMKNSKLRLRFE